MLYSFNHSYPLLYLMLAANFPLLCSLIFLNASIEFLHPYLFICFSITTFCSAVACTCFLNKTVNSSILLSLNNLIHPFYSINFPINSELVYILKNALYDIQSLSSKALSACTLIQVIFQNLPAVMS